MFVYLLIVSERDTPPPHACQQARFSGPLSASPTSLFSEPWKEVSHPPGQITASAPGVPQPSAPICRHQMNWGWQICSDSQSFFIPRVAGLVLKGGLIFLFLKWTKTGNKIFVETSNQLEFASNRIPVVISDLCVCLWRKLGLGKRKKFEIFFFKAETLRKKTQKPAIQLSDKKEQRTRTQRGRQMNITFRYEA